MAVIIDGKALAAKICAEVAQEAAKLPRKPKLAAVLVGNDPASQIYVRNKEKDCVKCGIDSVRCDLPGNTTQQELLALVDKLNDDESVDGILVQLPLPGHIDESVVINAIKPDKDIKSGIKTAVKKVNAAIQSGDQVAAKAALVDATVVIDKAATKGVLHSNTASRKVSRLAQAVNKMA